TARAAVFHFMAIGQLFFIYPARHARVRPLPNSYVHAAVAVGIVIQVAVAGLASSARLLGNSFLPLPLWGVVAVAAGLSWAVAEGIAAIVWRRHGSKAGTV